MHRDNWLFSHFESKPKLFDIDTIEDARRSATVPTKVVIKPQGTSDCSDGEDDEFEML